ncbi:MAG: aldehyde dehydrogenase [Clostridia bacterium]|nr:aldehyde dehydrogenase [Clostridia bacterium]
MNREDISKLVDMQRSYFAGHATLPVSVRIDALKRLKAVIAENEERIAEALRADLGKSAFEGYMCETGLVLSEISYMLRHIRTIAREKTVCTPLPQFASRSFVKPMPYGVVLIMSPWNYPFLLSIDPLVDAIAAGNTVILKPSAYSPRTSALIEEIISTVFPREYVAVVTGGRAENQALLEEKFDYIFFTGSKNVGRTILEKAAPHLTPATLELGGKSPCIVDASANLKLAARRIVFGKYLNCGQTCVAPDYLLCEASVKDKFIGYLKEEVRRQYGSDPLNNNDYGRIVSERHFDRICGLIDPAKLAIGGKSDRETLRIEPTILDNVSFNDPVMQEEIFGPVLPVLTFNTIDEVIGIVNFNPKPLALYHFSSDKHAIREIREKCAFGGGCTNDVVIHLATSSMGFGGVGESGMGAYHGKVGFDTFSHKKSIVDKKTWLDLPMRYQPYKKLYGKLLHMFLK